VGCNPFETAAHAPKKANARADAALEGGGRHARNLGCLPP